MTLHIMKSSIKFVLTSCAGLAFALAQSASATPVSNASTIGSQLGNVSIFSNTYFVTGASSTIYSSTFSGAATTIGAESNIRGDVTTVAAATIGAGTIITGELKSSGTFAQRAADASAKISEVQSQLSSMVAANYLQAIAPSDMTLYAGVYGASSWTVAAGVTIMLDGQGLDDQSWVFNFTDFFVVGAGAKFQLTNVGKNANIIWNVNNGYTSLGAGTELIGTILSSQYITMGAGTIINNIQGRCTGIYSAVSYVSAGASTNIGGSSCNFNSYNTSVTAINSSTPLLPLVSSVPEPETFSLLLAGLLAIIFVSRRRTTPK